MINRKNTTSEMLAIGGYFMLQLASRLAVELPMLAYFYVYLAPEGVSGDALLQLMDEYFTRLSLPMVAAANVLVLLMLFVIGRIKKRGFLVQCRLKSLPRSKAAVAVCVLAGVAANFWFSFVLNSGLVPDTMLESYQTAYSPLGAASLPLELLTLIILAPLAEEIIFRGVILGHLKKIVPVGAAIVFQGLLFGCVHGDPLWIAYASVLGCIIGLVRVRCASVWAGIVFHMAFNGASYLFTMFADALWENAPARIAVFALSAAVFVACMWKICTPPKLAKR